MKTMFLILAKLMHSAYGYEALNLCFRIFPSTVIIYILKAYGAKIGNGVRIQPPFIIHNADQMTPPFRNLEIQDNCYIGRYCIFDLQGQITVEAKSTLSHRVVLNTHTNAGKSPLSEAKLPISQGNICIKRGAYLGLNVTVLQDVEIGKESIIGANALVNKSIPDYSIAFGIPCKIHGSTINPKPS
ncbi:acyltransferase [Phaeodactylibacter xiamenensis]|uniref:acyltransferase n=1 Tax=Phaeodactylibacter xiamenensis TaxID=1524460 RepID=UPI003CCC3DAC